MAGEFKDLFSDAAPDYARFRPTYPVELFDFVCGLCTNRRRAWDCGTGNGQVALALADRFDAVLATDASRAQVAEAAEHSRVEYRVATAEAPEIEPDSIDLVTVAQAGHWFRWDEFVVVAERVLRPGGVLAVFCYRSPVVDAAIAAPFAEFSAAVRPYWPPERRLVDEGYRSLEMPWPLIPAPELAIRREMNRSELLGYIGTWSATRAAQRAGVDPLAELVEGLSAWNDPDHRLEVRWPLSIRVARKPAAESSG